MQEMWLQVVPEIGEVTEDVPQQGVPQSLLEQAAQEKVNHRRLHEARLRAAKKRGTHTEEEWEALKAFRDYRCSWCAKREPEIKLTKDHIVPVRDEACTDLISNIQPLCLACNIRRVWIVNPRPPVLMDDFINYGKLGGLKRARNLSPERRREIAVKASKAAAKKRSGKKK